MYGYDRGYRDFSDMVGKTFLSVEGLHPDSDQIVFKFTDGSVYNMWHEQDCCECVTVDDVCGDLDDLIDGVVLDAREDTNSTDPFGKTGWDVEESFTWTFYTIQTNKGSVVIRWFGSSNGYYSESVSFKLINKGETNV